MLLGLLGVGGGGGGVTWGKSGGGGCRGEKCIWKKQLQVKRTKEMAANSRIVFCMRTQHVHFCVPL